MRVLPAPRVASTPLARSDNSRTRTTRMLALAVLGGSAIGVYLAFSQGARSGGRVLFAPTFPNGGLVTNEYAFYNPLDPRAVPSPVWEVTSGSLFALDGNGWTGRPDGQAADAGSSSATDSAVFRLRTRQSDFGNVGVSFRLLLKRLVTTPRTPPQAYDGVHIWLRYHSPDELYFASVSRRDGSIVIGKKLPEGLRGRYVDLARVPGQPLALNRWSMVKATVVSSGNTVRIRVFVDGRLLATAVDSGAGGPPILGPGRVGIRGDNAEFEFSGFRVTQE